MRWGHQQAVPLADFSAPHQCVDWSSLDGWAAQHVVKDPFRPGYISHPTFGPSFPEGNGDRLGVVHDS